MAAIIAICAALARSFDLDEGYAYLILNGHPRLMWPAGIFTRADIAGWFAGTSSFARISADLRHYDVHPPLWFYTEEIWRRIVGPDLLAARLLSVALMVCSLILTARVARRVRASAALAVAFTGFSYAVLYTGATVRMYPLANTLLLLGVLALLRMLAPRGGQLLPRSFLWAGLAGVSFGLATATHLFTVFPAALMGATAAVALLVRRRRAEVVIAAVAALPFVGWAASYYRVQQTHDWQFEPFHVGGMLMRIAKCYAAALFGGTPVYVPHAWQMPLTGLLAALLLGTLATAALGVGRLLRDVEGWLVLAGVLAMPVALFGVGASVGKQVVELRYLIYGIPFLAMFLARGLCQQRLLPPLAGAVLAAAFLAAQLAGAVAMPFAHMTQQAARPAIAQIARLWEPGAILLLPPAEDTSGMTLDYAYEARPGWPMALLRRDADGATLLPLVRGRPRVFLIVLTDAAGTAAIARAHAILEQAGWRSAGAPGGDDTRHGYAWEEMLPPN